ncbi:MAG: hypothetical protein Q8O66_00250 [bacterium]|nr:hypothetical protein [bacterium]
MKINKILSTLISVAVSAIPVAVLAATPEVPVDTYTWLQIKALVTGSIYTIGGLAVAVMLLASGVMFVTAGGSPEKVATARNTLLFAVVGGVVLVLALSIWGIVKGWI